MQKDRKRATCIALLVVGLTTLGMAGSAQATLTGNYTKFAQCPYTNPEVLKCIYSVTNSGEVILGSKKVPIVNATTIQGGYGETVEEKEEAEFAQFYGATNGDTLSKTPQPVPGGLAGILNCKEISDIVLRISCELALEGPFTGLNTTLELAKPASDIRISENNLAGEVGTTLELPVKAHLENPFLGKACYVGSEKSPIIWKLTTGTTKPPAPNKPITGTGGIASFLEEGRIIVLEGTKLVDNSWSAPGVSGCGGFPAELLLNPIINTAAGLPAAAGTNTAVLNNTINVGNAFAVNKNDKENP